ncbi:hypothetical protein MKEN_00571400 [Mycena kentingensis (nom. inval.)]|nr:hypothetical protein MKEN_00571400 [Mycena kentingensis (nom. inval.)]
MPPTRVPTPHPRDRRVQYWYDGMNDQEQVPGLRVNDRRAPSYASLSSATLVSICGDGDEKNKADAKVASVIALLESVARGYENGSPLCSEPYYAQNALAIGYETDATGYYDDTDAKVYDQIFGPSDAIHERDASPTCTCPSDLLTNDAYAPMGDDVARAILCAVYAYLVAGDWREMSSADVLRLNSQVARLRLSFDDAAIEGMVSGLMMDMALAGEGMAAEDDSDREDTVARLPASSIPTLEWEWAMELVARDRAFALVEIPHTSVRARHELAALELLARRGVAVNSDDVLAALNAQDWVEDLERAAASDRVEMTPEHWDWAVAEILRTDAFFCDRAEDMVGDRVRIELAALDLLRRVGVAVEEGDVIAVLRTREELQAV